MKRITAIMAALCLVFALTACGGNTDDGGNTPGPSGSGVYQNVKYGWSTAYDETMTEVTEADGVVRFAFKEGPESFVEISYTDEKDPNAALDTAVSEWGEDLYFDDYEGYFPGTEDRWSYSRTALDPSGDIMKLYSIMAGEYNGGVLLFDCRQIMPEEEDESMKISDWMTGILSSMTYENFEPQTLLADYPGTYTGEAGNVVLNEDHTGTMNIEGDQSIFWETSDIYVQDTDLMYMYSLDGDTLSLTAGDGTEYVFVRE